MLFVELSYDLVSIKQLNFRARALFQLGKSYSEQVRIEATDVRKVDVESDPAPFAFVFNQRVVLGPITLPSALFDEIASNRSAPFSFSGSCSD